MPCDVIVTLIPRAERPRSTALTQVTRRGVTARCQYVFAWAVDAYKLVFCMTNGPVVRKAMSADDAAPVSTIPCPLGLKPVQPSATPCCALAFPVQPMPKSATLTSEACAVVVSTAVCFIAGVTAANTIASRTLIA